MLLSSTLLLENENSTEESKEPAQNEDASQMTESVEPLESESVDSESELFHESESVGSELIHESESVGSESSHLESESVGSESELIHESKSVGSESSSHLESESVGSELIHESKSVGSESSSHLESESVGSESIHESKSVGSESSHLESESVDSESELIHKSKSVGSELIHESKSVGSESSSHLESESVDSELIRESESVGSESSSHLESESVDSELIHESESVGSELIHESESVGSESSSHLESESVGSKLIRESESVGSESSSHLESESVDSVSELIHESESVGSKLIRESESVGSESSSHLESESVDSELIHESESVGSELIHESESVGSELIRESESVGSESSSDLESESVGSKLIRESESVGSESSSHLESESVDSVSELVLESESVGSESILESKSVGSESSSHLESESVGSESILESESVGSESSSHLESESVGSELIHESESVDSASLEAPVTETLLRSTEEDSDNFHPKTDISSEPKSESKDALTEETEDISVSQDAEVLSEDVETEPSDSDAQDIDYSEHLHNQSDSDFEPLETQTAGLDVVHEEPAKPELNNKDKPLQTPEKTLEDEDRSSFKDPIKTDHEDETQETNSLEELAKESLSAADVEEQAGREVMHAQSDVKELGIKIPESSDLPQDAKTPSDASENVPSEPASETHTESEKAPPALHVSEIPEEHDPKKLDTNKMEDLLQKASLNKNENTNVNIAEDPQHTLMNNGEKVRQSIGKDEKLKKELVTESPETAPLFTQTEKQIDKVKNELVNLLKNTLESEQQSPEDEDEELLEDENALLSSKTQLTEDIRELKENHQPEGGQLTESQQSRNTTKQEENNALLPPEEPEYSDNVLRLTILRDHLKDEDMERMQKYFGLKNLFRIEAMFSDLDLEMKSARELQTDTEEIERTLDQIMEDSENSILDATEDILNERQRKSQEHGHQKEPEAYDVLDVFQEIIFSLRQKYSAASDSAPLVEEELLASETGHFNSNACLYEPSGCFYDSFQVSPKIICCLLCFNPIQSTASYFKCLFAVKPIALNLLHAFCCQIDRLDLIAKRHFSIIVETNTFSSFFYCQVFTDLIK